MFELLYDPVKVIKSFRVVSFSRVLMYLLVASLFFVSGLWAFSLTFGIPFTSFYLFFCLFCFVFCVLLLSFLLSVSLHILDGRAGFYEGLVSVVLWSVAPAVAFFFAGALSSVSIYLSGLVLVYGFVVGFASLFRCVKEFFDLDYAGVLLGCLVVDSALLLVGLAFFFL